MCSAYLRCPLASRIEPESKEASGWLPVYRRGGMMGQVKRHHKEANRQIWNMGLFVVSLY
jgi:hypothetical protein